MKKAYSISLVILAMALAAALPWLLQVRHTTSLPPTGLANAGAFQDVPLATRQSDQLIGKFEERLRRGKNDFTAMATLGRAYLQRAKTSADYNYFNKAEALFHQLLRANPQSSEAMAGFAELALGRHAFAEGLAWAQKARAANPYTVRNYGYIADALIELGRYSEAVEAVQTMVDMRPDLSSYSRVSYLRELYGDLDGAVEAMRMAVQAGAPGDATTAWCRAQLGHLFLQKGDLERAESGFLEALRHYPNYAPAFSGLAKIAAARGEFSAAESALAEAIAAAPLPALFQQRGELYESMGRTGAAEQQYELARQLLESERENGIDPDLELVMLAAARGRSGPAYCELARKAYAKRPTLLAADALGWLLYIDGRYAEAETYAEIALHLGTQNAVFLYHAGMIASRLGKIELAKTRLRRALELNPYFSAAGAREARAELRRLQAGGMLAEFQRLGNTFR